jgi:hypothetical protein
MKYFLSFLLTITIAGVNAQELYVFTEPASNMAAKSIGVRLLYKQFKMEHNNKFSTYRIEPEIMLGVSKKLMVHVNGYASSMFQSKLRVEGGSLYAKYRFFSKDDIHSHFRLAAFGKVAVIDNPTVLTYTEPHAFDDGNGGITIHDLTNYKVNNEIDIDGSNSGIAGGIIATKLINRLAVSSSVSYLYRLNNIKNKKETIVPWKAVNYTLSAGYLLFPKEYTSYKQTNINLYAEFLGNSFLGNHSWDKGKYFIDVAPAVQFIINSIARVDIGYRTQLAGNTVRMANSSFLVRVEYNFLNILSKK